MNLKKNIVQTVIVVISMTILKANASCAPLLDHPVRQLAGDQVDRLCEVYQGQVVMIVNTASKCGFTSQYTGLELLHQTFSTRGFSVLAFPCNQFGSQEPGTHEEIATFCETQFGVTFPMMAKIEVNGDNRHPLYAELCKVPDHEGREAIKWNFNKFIVREDGSVERYSHRTEPSELPL